MNLFNGDEDLQRRYADALKTSVDKTFGVEMNNERSLAKEITEGFEALKSMRNNEPVAWMYERPNGSAKLTFVREPMAGTVVTETPLYTHPVKRELTDEEIEGIARANVDGHSSMEQLKWFARAILRKAQEK